LPQIPLTRLAALAVAGVLLITFCMQASDSPASDQELSLPQYIEQLRTASEVLDGKNPASIREFRLSLPNTWVVQTGGQSLSVNTDWLTAALLLEEDTPSTTADQLQQARQHLAALREAAEELASLGDLPDLAHSHAQVDRILRGAEFQGSHGPSWLDKLKARAFAWISRQLDKIFGHIGVSAAVGDTIVWILIACAALLLAFWAVRSMIATASRSQIDLRGAAPPGGDWRHWAAEARAAAERADYRAAIHAAYWTAVARLEENHLLPEDRSRTPRESLRLIEAANAAYAPLSHLTRRFELTWYGYRVATSNDWADAMQQLETLGCLRSSMPATAGS
jgi:hypothetical protein